MRSLPRTVGVSPAQDVLSRELVTAIPPAEVTATDLNAAMVEFGSRQAPGAAWQRPDAATMTAYVIEAWRHRQRPPGG
jgi:hypothetical protein